jgi:glycosyltransferase involved in cell wall biosynthesis
MRVLFVNHTSSFSGAEVAMLRLLESLPGNVERAVACPPEGPLAAALDARGVRRLQMPGTDLSFKISPYCTAKGLTQLAASTVVFARVARGWGADVIHANGTRAGLLAVPVARLGGPALVVQVHDHLPHTRLGRLVRQGLAHGADEVIGVSRSTARNFDEGLSHPTATPVYISIDLERFNGPHDDAAVRRELGVGPDTPLVGEVAQITPWKGQMDAIEAFAKVREEHPQARLVLVGKVAFDSTRYDNHQYERDLHERVRELGLERYVHFLGHRSDVPEIMSALDVLVLPSWEEPFGTAALEAMAAGTVASVTSEGGASEYVEDGVAGRVLPPRDPDRWAGAISELLREPERRHAMARRAQARAQRFTDRAYADGCMEAYERALHKRKRAILAEPAPQPRG